MVGDDRERLEGSLRETTGVPAKDVALHLLMEGRVGEEPPAPVINDVYTNIIFNQRRYRCTNCDIFLTVNTKKHKVGYLSTG